MLFQTTFDHLCLNILDADDGLLVLLCGLVVVPLFEELVPLTVKHRHHLQPLLIVHSPRLPVVLTGLLNLSIILTVNVYNLLPLAPWTNVF